MKLQKTSVESYELLDNLPKSQKKVLEKLASMKVASNLEIARELDWDVNRVTPRVHELRQRYLIIEHSRQKSPITNRKSIMWEPVFKEKTKKSIIEIFFGL